MQLIYSLYLQGCGQKEIARRLMLRGERHRQLELNGAAEKSGIRTKPVMASFLWTYASVKNIPGGEGVHSACLNEPPQRIQQR